MVAYWGERTNDFRENDNRNILFFADFFCKKAEKKLAVSSYKSAIKQSINNSKKKNQISKSIEEYIYFKLDKFSCPEYNNLNSILCYESSYSIIDRYLSLIEVLKIFISISDSKSLKAIKPQVAYLNKHFKDNNFINICAVLDLPLPKSVIENLDYRAFDNFVNEDFSECQRLFTELIQDDPNNFDNYKPLIYSFALNGLQVPNSLLDSSSVQGAILNILNDIINSNKMDFFLKTTLSLKRYSLNFSSFNLSSQLNVFFREDIKFKKAVSFEVLSKSPLSIYIYRYFNGIHKANKYLDSLNVKNSLAISYEKSKVNKHFHDFIKKFEFTLYKKVELAEFYQNIGNYEESIGIWETIEVESITIIPIQESYIKGLFNCYVELDLLDKAVDLYISSFEINQRTPLLLDCTQIHKKIKKKKYKNVKKTLELALFFHISGINNDNEIQYIIEMFLNTLNAVLPSKVDWLNSNLDIDRIVYFLNTICGQEILMHFSEIEGTASRISERLSICKILMDIDVANYKEYEKEYNKLTEYQIMLEGQQELDESKIYVNEEGLIKELGVDEFEGLFDRFSTYSIFKSTGVKLYLFDMSISTPKLILERPALEVFKELFQVILEKFVGSKFGISVYLSTRIRHGVFLGEIRPIFERNHLISLKQSTTNLYKDINYWKRDNHIESNQILQDILKKQSEKVDMLIASIIENNFQININNEKPEGWFKYQFDENWYISKATLLAKVKNYKEFINEVIKLLWIETDDILADIRNKMENQVKNEFIDILDNTLKELNNKIGMNSLPANLSANITKCRGEISNVLPRVSGWFNRVGTRSSDFKIHKIINLVERVIKNNHSHKTLEITKNIDNTFVFKGKNYQHFIDIFRTIINNSIVHSQEDAKEIPVEITIKEVNSTLAITILNSYPDIEKAKKSLCTPLVA